VPPVDRTARPHYANYVLAVLVAVNMFNFIDRQIVAILLQQIKQEFSASDASSGCSRASRSSSCTR
jgi:hypothetical protein